MNINDDFFTFEQLVVLSTKAQKWQIEKKNRVVLKFGRIVEGDVLNNILKVPADRR